MDYKNRLIKHINPHDCSKECDPVKHLMWINIKNEISLINYHSLFFEDNEYKVSNALISLAPYLTSKEILNVFKSMCVNLHSKDIIGQCLNIILANEIVINRKELISCLNMISSKYLNTCIINIIKIEDKYNISMLKINDIIDIISIYDGSIVSEVINTLYENNKKIDLEDILSIVNIFKHNYNEYIKIINTIKLLNIGISSLY